MARTQTLVQLNDDLVELLDQEASRRGVSRSALIREAAIEYLDASREGELTRRIIEGYERIPPGEPDEWGNLEALSDISSAESLAKLDAEEEREGLEW